MVRGQRSPPRWTGGGSMTFPEVVCVLGIGRNYRDHAAELGNDAPERPMVFAKAPFRVTGEGDPIVLPACCETEQVDYEGELAVLLGRDTKDVALEDALSYVAGYAAANDITARWWQKHGSGGQFVRGKSFDSFCPIGPWRSAEEVSDPQALRIVTTLNGEVVQDGATADMIFSVREIIAHLSQDTTLPAGTVLLTGTPSGVGAGRTPPRFLRGGDSVEVSIAGVGTLCNPVQA
ncbi:MAG: FAA hydrolase family protein [Phycisphaeraceae bacterium]|nr:MAG: FAA hydrolase family protein [Phycisphaeraceae bacterium]